MSISNELAKEDLYKKALERAYVMSRKELEKLVNNVNEFKSFLILQAKHPRFNARNILLIKAQKPEGTLFFDKKTWASDICGNRKIKSQENSVRLIVPRSNNRGQYELKAVFDISQTNHPKDYDLSHVMKKNINRLEEPRVISQAIKECVEPQKLEPQIQSPQKNPIFKDDYEKGQYYINKHLEKKRGQDEQLKENHLLSKAIAFVLAVRYFENFTEKINEDGKSLENSFRVWQQRVQEVMAKDKNKGLKAVGLLISTVNKYARDMIYKIDSKLNDRYLQLEMKKELMNDLKKTLEKDYLRDKAMEIKRHLPKDVTLEYGD